MTTRARIRASALRWVATHSFPWRRELLIDQHHLPSVKLARLADLIVPRAGEPHVDVVEAVPGIRVEVDMRSRAQRAVAFGMSDETELALLHRLVRPGDAVVDAGANIGLYTLTAARLAAPGVVHAFEPEPRTAERLRRNVELNGLTNVHVEQCALGAAEGISYLRAPDPLEPGLATIIDDGATIAKVRVRTLDEYAAANGIEGIALLKIDVEGAEAQVLEGAGGLLDRAAVDAVLVEVLAGRTDALRLLANRGFMLERVLPADAPELLAPCTPAATFAYANVLARRHSPPS